MEQGHDLIRRTLMCKDHEVVTFEYDTKFHSVAGKPTVHDKFRLPTGALGKSGRFEKPALDSWIRMRAVPMLRPSAESVVVELGFSSTDELMLAGLGLSLSDQYWLKPPGFERSWSQINFFENPFSEELGLVLAPRDEASASDALKKLGRDPLLLSSSADATTNGNLPKFWKDDNGTRRLFKSGKQSNFMLEPYNEVIATEICGKLLSPGDFVPYRWESGTSPKAYSSSPCMVDADHELIPAGHIMNTEPRSNSISRYEQYARILERHGIADARRQLSKMLVIDHLICNWDRHWSNFGVIANSETGRWESVAPLFDMGESLWCDRVASQSALPYRFLYPMPFIVKMEEQMERFAEDVSWLEPIDADEVCEIAVTGVERNVYAKATPGFSDFLEASLRRTAADINSLLSTRKLVPKPAIDDGPEALSRQLSEAAGKRGDDTKKGPKGRGKHDQGRLRS